MAELTNLESKSPIQERHYQDVSKGSLTLAREEDPNEPA
jgi:hypothetical protein